MPKSEDWPFTGESPELQDMAESEEQPDNSRDLAYQLETTVGWACLGLARVCTDTAPSRRSLSDSR